MTQPDETVVITLGELTQLAWRAAGAGMAVAGAAPDEIQIMGADVEDTLAELVNETRRRAEV